MQTQTYTRGKINPPLRPTDQRPKDYRDKRDSLIFQQLDVVIDWVLSSKQKEARALAGPDERARILRQGVEDYRSAWTRAMRFGYDPSPFEPGIDQETRAIMSRGIERRDMGTGGQGAYPGATSGFFVPVEFANKFEAAAAYYGPMLDLSTEIVTKTGGAYQYPIASDPTTLGEQVDEHSQVTQADVVVNQAQFKSYKYSSKLIRVSMELVQDWGFDFEGFVSDIGGERIGRLLNQKFTTGTGVNEPLGFVTSAPVGAVATGSSTDDGSAATGQASLGTDDFTALEKSVDPIYRIGAKFMMHSDTLATLRNVKNKNGGLEFPGLSAGTNGQNTIFGYPVVPNESMPALSAGNKSVAFGDFSHYVYRRAGNLWVQRLTERFAEAGEVAYVCWLRADGRLLDAGTHPVKLMQQAA